MSISHEQLATTPELSHGINFVNFLENINKKAFGQKAEISQLLKCGSTKYNFGLDGKTLISIQSDDEKIIVSSGVDQKYTVVIDPNFRPKGEDSDEGKLNLEYVINSVIVEGLFPGRKNKDPKAEMYKAISDKTSQFRFSYQDFQLKTCTIKISEFRFRR